MRPQPLIAVTDVEASSRWYQKLLGLQSNHGGSAYEQLLSDGQLVMQLHSFEVEHHHGPIANRDDKPYGNGVLLWFEVDDFDAILERATEMSVDIVMPRHRNPPDGNGGPNHWECWMRDPDGYVVVVASPYGTADGTWRPGNQAASPLLAEAGAGIPGLAALNSGARRWGSRAMHPDNPNRLSRNGRSRA